LGLDFPLSLFFSSAADRIAEHAFGIHEYAAADCLLALFYLIAGSLWYMLLAILIRSLWRSNNLCSRLIRELWQRNTR